MKANHNCLPLFEIEIPLLPMSKDTINESKSQHAYLYVYFDFAVAYEQRYNK